MSDTQKRPPVVVVLGHVDHGKTSLLDYIRKTNKTAGEYGGITQSIGAYVATLDVKEYGVNKLTFIDTPGHEAFTQLRSRGADVADIAILIVDAVDSVMPQTVESLYHIKNAKLPFIVALNKIDLPGANIQKVKNDLMKEGVLFEGMGGDTPALGISAKTGDGVKELLEMLLFMTDLKELTYNPTNPLKAYIIESRKDRNGVVASAIIKDGRLAVAETVFAKDQECRIKALVDDNGHNVKEVLPSQPFVILGFKEVPEVGIELSRTKTEKDVKQVEVTKPTNLTDFFASDKEEKLRVIIKADTQGSLDALLSTLAENKSIEISLAAVGDINKSDVFLANLTGAIVLGFAVKPDKTVIQVAEQEKVVLKTYSLIYELLDELTEVSDLMKEKETKARQLKGEAKILANFIIDGEKIAGVKVLKGKIALNDQIELYRNDKLIAKSKVVSLKTRARDIDEVKKNEEGGMLFYPKLDFNIGDMVQSYSI
jgi:translation initiation factor IF-2